MMWFSGPAMAVLWPGRLSPVVSGSAVFLLGAALRLGVVFLFPPADVGSGHLWPGVTTRICDMLSLIIVLGLLGHRGLDARWGLLYALNPVIVFSFTVQGHPAALPLSLLLAAVFCYDRKRYAAAAVFLAAGIYFEYRLAFISMMCAGYLLLQRSCRDDTLSDRKPDLSEGCLVAAGALFLLTPEARLFQICWIIPFLAVIPGVSWLLPCLAMGVVMGGRYGLVTAAPVWTGVYQGLMLLFYMLLARDIFWVLARLRATHGWPSPGSVSVIIPTLNEGGGGLAACIRAALADPVVGEVIVADAGSGDETCFVARENGARVIQHTASFEKGGGRGGQIFAGLQIARGDVAAVLHADALIEARTFSRIIEILSKNPSVIGGAVGCAFDTRAGYMRWIDAANHFRAAFLGIGFGDQVQFFRREPVLQACAFPAIPLMEDVELSLRLSRLGRKVYLFGNTRVSSRRWEQKGIGNAATVVGLVAVYLLQRLWKQPDTAGMYRRYYGK